MDFLNYNDDRLKKINAVKEENARMGIFDKANKIFGSKKWEDDWRRIYQFAGIFGLIGNIVSVLLGLSGGIYITYSFTQNWAIAFVLGIVVVFVLEVVKSVAISEATIHGLKGNTISFGIFLTVASLVLVASAYFSIESGMQTPYFKDFVAKSSTHITTVLPTEAQYGKEISKLNAELTSIEKEREAYTAKHPNNGAKWLKADQYERVKAQIEVLQNKAETETAEQQQEATNTAQIKAADSLSWWYWAIVILSELCVLFGYSFGKYYLFKCRELALIDGKNVKTETIAVNSAPTNYETIQVGSNVLTREQELLAEIERLRAMPQQQKPPTNNATTITNTIGYRRAIVDTVSTPILGVNTVNIATLTADTPDDILLGAYRAANGSIAARKGRNTETAAKQIAAQQEKQRYIQLILQERGKKIVLVDRAYTIVPIS